MSVAMQTGQKFADRYRTLTRDDVVATLLLEGYACEADHDAARTDAGAALESWIAAGLPSRITDAGPLFDPVEVVCHAKALGRQGRDDFWQRRFVATLRRFVSDLAAEPVGPRTLTLRRRFDIGHVDLGTKLRLRMPLPLPGRSAKLNIQPELPQLVEGHRIGDGRLEARVTANGDRHVCIGARVDTEPGAPPGQSLPDGDLLLRPREGLIAVTDEVAALAQRLAGVEPPERAVRAFWDHLIDNYTFCPIHYDQVPPNAATDWVIATGTYDCRLAAALFIALCRARGIAGRLVGGNFLYRRSPSNHFWAEVWLDNNGWTAFDFLSWDLSLGGQDSAWRDRFFGRIEPRLVTECLPAQFTGATGVAVPDAWHIVRTIKGAGVDLHLVGIDGRSVYRDHIAVH